MKRKATLGALLALAAAAPAIVAPRLVATANAQPATTAPAEYPDVPRGHWAYEALNRLSQAGIIEGLPNGTYAGNKPMTRYEFAVAIARLLDKIPASGGGTAYDDTAIRSRLDALEARPDLSGRVAALEARPIPDITRAEVMDLISALRTEFANELSRLGVRVTAVEDRVTILENRVPAPPRLTVTPSILHRFGSANYISNETGIGPVGFGGRTIFNGQEVGVVPTEPSGSVFRDMRDSKFSYTDFELRLTDRVTDRLSASAALRSLSGTQEDPWAGELFNEGHVYVREAFAVANLGDRSWLGTKGLNLIVGRQRTKIGQGLLYDNDLQPTDQLHAAFNLGPVALNALVGTNNNLDTTFGGHPYLSQGSAAFFGANGLLGADVGAGAVGSGAGVGFPGAGGATFYSDDNESLIRGGINLFRIAGQPVGLGITRQFDGVGDQNGTSLDLSVPLFNRTVGIEYVKQSRYANGSDASGKAYNITVPVLRSRILDLNAAYGKADDEFEFFLSSAANPFARTYGEALFDRPLALGAPMINGDAGGVGEPAYLAAKKAWDVNGTVRLPLGFMRRIPLDFRYFTAKGTGDRDLGNVWTVGSTFNVSPGLDLELKYGRYNPDLSGFENIQYVRVGANVGF